MQASAKVTSVPSPVGGLNALDNLIAMDQMDAIALENLVPQPYGCSMRKGFAKYAIDLPAFYTTSLSYWSDITGAIKMFAWSGTQFFDVTSPGSVGAALISGLSNAWWQFVNFSNAAGTHMLAFNGQDNPIWYSSAGLQRLTSAAGPGQWTGVDPAFIIQATVHQRRVWGVQKDTTKGWYLAPDAVTGAATEFNFGPLFKRGGYLAMLATWTADVGSGSTDKLVAISSEGEAAVYSGTDPATATTWNLVGVYNIGQPVAGRRFCIAIAGDLLVLTQTGLVSMSALLASTQVKSNQDSVYSKKIQFLLSEATSTLGDLNGWQLTYVPTINLLLVNVPSIYAIGSGQLVYNTVNGAWCTFAGYDAACWSVVDGLPYFGGFRTVNRGWYGTKDKVEVDGSGGEQVYGFVRQAYSYLNMPAVQKQVGMYRPNFITESKASYTAEITYDFNTPTIVAPYTAPPDGPFSLWNSGLWNSALWSGGDVVQRDWSQAAGIGVAMSINMRISANGEVTWVSTDYTYKGGGPL